MITHKILLKEAEELKAILKKRRDDHPNILGVL